MNEEPGQQSEWRRRITESMAATTYEQLKALVEGITKGFDEVRGSFAALEERLKKIEGAANESRMAFGYEAEQVRTSLGEHADAVTSRVERASAEMVKDLSDKSQELSAQLAALGEEMSATLTDLHASQLEQLTRSRSELTESATSITTRVDAAIAGLMQEMRSHGDTTAVVVDASAAATRVELDRATDAMAVLEHVTQDAVARAQGNSAHLDERITRLEDDLRSNRDEMLSVVEASARQLVATMDELSAAITDRTSRTLEDISARMASPGEIAAALRDVFQDQSAGAATRWDDLVRQLAVQRPGSEAESNDVALVALIRSLEQVLDARDQRLIAMLEDAARALPSRRRVPFLSRAKSSFRPRESESDPGKTPDPQTK